MKAYADRFVKLAQDMAGVCDPRAPSRVHWKLLEFAPQCLTNQLKRLLKLFSRNGLSSVSGRLRSLSGHSLLWCADQYMYPYVKFGLEAG